MAQAGEFESLRAHQSLSVALNSLQRYPSVEFEPGGPDESDDAFWFFYDVPRTLALRIHDRWLPAGAHRDSEEQTSEQKKKGAGARVIGAKSPN